jgi:hypothetical protein
MRLAAVPVFFWRDPSAARLAGVYCLCCSLIVSLVVRAPVGEAGMVGIEFRKLSLYQIGFYLVLARTKAIFLN